MITIKRLNIFIDESGDFGFIGGTKEMEDNYPKAYKEVIEILNYVPQESTNKIPQTMIDTFKAKMNVNYDFKVDINKSFEEQNLLDETKAILANIFRDYWATQYQKERIETKEKIDREKTEQEKHKKYNPDNIFINRKNIVPKYQEVESNLIIQKENKFKKLLNKVKKILHIV